MTSYNKVKGFSLSELVVSSLISTLVVSALLSHYAKSSQLNTQVKSVNDQASQLQQVNNWFKQQLAFVGNAQLWSNVEPLTKIDIEEIQFINQNPIHFPSDFTKFTSLGSYSSLVNSDVLVFSHRGSKSCTGQSFSALEGRTTHFVEQIYLEDNNLKCRSFDGRTLLANDSAAAPNRSVSIFEGVSKLTFLYGVLSKSAPTTFLWLSAEGLAEKRTEFQVRLIKVKVTVALADKQIVNEIVHRLSI